MELLSIGGVGGCGIATALRKLNVPAYPYDWILSTQSFVISSFLNPDKFFVFDERFVHNNIYLTNEDKSGVILHDFHNFTAEKDKVIDRYKRRFERLKNLLENDKPILLIRAMDNMTEILQPFYDPLYKREEEDIKRWIVFRDDLEKRFNKEFNLLLLSNNPNTFFEDRDRVFFRRIREPDDFYKIISSFKNS